MTWIAFTILAAFMQAWRNAFQAELGKSVAVLGVTLARFLWASPIAALYLVVLYQFQPAPLPTPSWELAKFGCGAAMMQIIATALMVKLFKLNNYAVGAGLAKSEAIAAAILGVCFFGTRLSALGWLGVLVGGVAVFLLSSKGKLQGLSITTVVLGILCGTSFAITSLWVREASLTLLLPHTHRAAWVLLSVLCLQTIVLSGYLIAVDLPTFQGLFRHWKLALAVSVSSCIGSTGWFSAMALQNVPYVKTLGQIEVFFMLAIGTWWLKQKPARKDGLGLILIAIAAILVLCA